LLVLKDKRGAASFKTQASLTIVKLSCQRIDFQNNQNSRKLIQST